MTYDIFWTPTAKSQLEYWVKYNPDKLKKLKSLCNDLSNDPTQGIGKPEHLKFLGKNIWSRRIDKENRLVYQIKKQKQIFIIQCRYHY